MKQLLYIYILLLPLLVSCQQEELTMWTDGTGTLSLENVSVETGHTVVTRAVDADLYIEIRKDGATDVLQKYAPGEDIPSRINLEAGEYNLTAYNKAYEEQAKWGTDAMGAPVYFLEQSFTIVAEEINRVEALVPMTNVGVRLSDEENLPEEFEGYTLIAEIGERSITLAPNETGYFPETAVGENLTYTLKAKNSEGEEVSLEKTTDSPLAKGKIYEIAYSLETRSFEPLVK